jgi:predicted nucleic acid-binding protein
MSALLLDTNVVSILFNQNHRLRDAAIHAVEGHQLAISFMSRAELLLWPALNNWGELRRATLLRHLALYTALYPDELTCALWVDIVVSCRRVGKPIHIADAWIAAIAPAMELAASDSGPAGL